MDARLLSVLAISVLAIAPVPSMSQEPATVEELISRGVKLHDQGDYRGAAELYEKALRLEPENGIALYELANTYARSEEYGLCVATVEKGVRADVPEELVGPLYAVAGSCLSAWGKPKKAIRWFEDGLRRRPNDVTLHFNIAVTLAARGQDEEAIDHLEDAIPARPQYSSPYYLLAALHRRRGHRVPSLLLFSRFVSLEPSGPRAATASTAVFELLISGIEAKSDNRIELLVALQEGRDNPYRSQELALSLAAAAAYAEEDEKRDEAELKVAALVSFLKMMREMGAPDGLENSAVWTWAADPLGRLNPEDELETLAYVMAFNAQIPGASDWVDRHSDRVSALTQVRLDEQHQR